MDVTNPKTGLTWMDRNLGATQAAISSKDAAAYGDLYQWGRGADGHQLRNSATSKTQSSKDQPGHGMFILSPYGNGDWRSPQNDILWQGVNGVNNPCPTGYRIPTDKEWEAERLSWSSNSSIGAFASPLKLPMAGYRSSNGGALIEDGEVGSYWSSTANNILFRSSEAEMLSSGKYLRARGLSVRCIKN
jgi:hypothetical protein